MTLAPTTRARLLAAVVLALGLVWLAGWPAAAQTESPSPTETVVPTPSPTSTPTDQSTEEPTTDASPAPAETQVPVDTTPPPPINKPNLGIFGSSAVAIISVGLAFVGLVLLLIVLVVPLLDRPAERVLKRGLRMYTRGAEAETQESGSSLTASSIGRAAVGLVQSVPKPAGYEDELQVKLDRAGWPLRASEFIVLRVLGGIFGALVGFALLASFPLGLVMGVAGVVIPGVALGMATGRREKAFLEQLPDTLTLLSGALKAGYGLLQAVDTAVQESPEPTKQEFQRVLTEARLGLPLTEALDDMATRVGSEDFAWVTVAINIQSQVGGNLAELLDTIADTLREREMVRRQIAVLSAEGRISGFVLTALPFGLSLYLWVVNPDYIGTLFTHWVGQILVGVGLLLMGVGIWWMRNLIRIDV